MPTAKASVPTANAAKYVQQLCKHWSHRLEVDLSDRKGVVKFPTAVATLDAGEDALLVTIEGGPHGIAWTHSAEVNDALLRFVQAA